MTPEERALARISGINDPESLRSMIANAKGQSALISKIAFRRLIGLSTTYPVGSLEHDCWMMIHTIEELRRAQKRSWRMNRLRRKIVTDGEREALDYCARKETKGFGEVLAFGLPELTAEAIVLRHPAQFSEDVRDLARGRLERAGVDVGSLPTVGKDRRSSGV